MASERTKTCCLHYASHILCLYTYLCVWHVMAALRSRSQPRFTLLAHEIPARFACILIFTEHRHHNAEEGDELYEIREQTSNVWKIHSNKIVVVIAPEAKRCAGTPPLYF